MSTHDRALMPDYLRLIALFGIVIVNVQYIAFPALGDFAEPLGETTADSVALWLVNGLALLKTYGLFSFMFGVGLGFLMRSAARRDLPFGPLYRNRMIGLLLLGLAHGCLFYPGDILVIYAVTGSILYVLRDWTVRHLVQVGVGLLVLQTVVGTPLFLAPSSTPADVIELERLINTGGSFLDALTFRSIGFALFLPVFLIAQGISALGWFCLGLAAVKSGMIDNAAHPLWQRARRVCLLPGVLLGLLGAALWQWGPGGFGSWGGFNGAGTLGAALVIIAAPIATFGYLGVIAALARPPGPILGRVLAAGGSSLSIYLGQSIILTTIFSGYGLGLWDEVDRVAATAIAVLVTIALIATLSVWRIWFKTGPFEWVLRHVTYAGVNRQASKST
ncbi:DUF418 domain-containing protein [Ahrensia marina]|uniref:DUF418 domain-containing protein n=1 Tax=Ahrensia marina TaxID=1514904 RepID=UPI0035D01BDE